MPKRVMRKARWQRREREEFIRLGMEFYRTRVLRVTLERAKSRDQKSKEYKMRGKKFFFYLFRKKKHLLCKLIYFYSLRERRADELTNSSSDSRYDSTLAYLLAISSFLIRNCTYRPSGSMKRGTHVSFFFFP